MNDLTRSNFEAYFAEAFESYFGSHADLFAVYPDGSYIMPTVILHWETWQAATKSVMPLQCPKCEGRLHRDEGSYWPKGDSK